MNVMGSNLPINNNMNQMMQNTNFNQVLPNNQQSPNLGTPSMTQTMPNQMGGRPQQLNLPNHQAGQYINQSPTLQYPQQNHQVNLQFLNQQITPQNSGQMPINGNRPTMQRPATIQHMGNQVGTPNAGSNPQVQPQMIKTPQNSQFPQNMIPQAPNSAPLPWSGNHSEHGSANPTPQMINQPNPGMGSNNSFQQQINLTNKMAPPQQMPLQGPAPGQLPPNSNSAQRMAAAQKLQSNMMAKPMTNEYYQNEMNAKIFKRNLGNAAAVRLLDIVEQVSNEPKDNLLSLAYWQRFIQLYFTPSSDFKLSMDFPDQDPLDKNFSDAFQAKPLELSSITAPRFFVSVIKAKQFTHFSITLLGISFQVMNNGFIFLLAKVHLHYHFEDGSMAHINGGSKILMNRDFRIEWIDCKLMKYQSSIGTLHLETVLERFLESNNYNMTKFNGKNNHTKLKNEMINQITSESMSFKYKSTLGLDHDSMRILQVSDIMTNLKSLMRFSMINNLNSPLKSLELFMTANNNHQLELAKQQAQAAQAQALMQAAQGTARAQPQVQVSQSQPPQLRRNSQAKSAGSISKQSLQKANNSPSPRTIDNNSKFKKRPMSTSVYGSVNLPLSTDPNLKRRK